MALNEIQQSEIIGQRNLASTTKRATVPALEEILYEPVQVLDHGFVRVIDYMGDDSAIVQAARVSYGQGTKKVNEDQGLINYLMRHRHTTPFEMCEIKFHVKLPLFVSRQWLRHRTANINEYSARYSILGNEFYLPKPENLAKQSASNRQGRDDVLSAQDAHYVLELLKSDAEQTYQHYQELLNEDTEGQIIDPTRPALARELARMNLTLNYYTEWYWKIDLHNLFHFLSLRADGHAQYEIRVYAEAMLEMVKRWVPFAYEAFLKYRLNGTQLSQPALAVIKSLLSGKAIEQSESGLSLREWRELMILLDRKI